MAVTRYVNTASTAGGDGTTNNTTGATRAYASLNEWEAAEEDDISSGAGAYQDTHIVNCSGSSADTTKCDITGWTTTTTYYITVSGETATQVAYDTSRYRIELTGDAYDGLLESDQDGTVLQDLQVQMTVTTQGQARCIQVQNGTQRLERCLAKGVISGGTAITPRGFLVLGGTSITFRACIAVDITGGDGSDVGFRMQGGDNISHLSNCTAYNCDVGFSTSQFDATAENCLFQDGGDGFQGTWSTTTAPRYNCSDITSDAPGANSQTGEVSFVDEANEDFTLASGDTVAKDNGVDLSGTFNYDFLNNTMPATWPIGAMQAAAAAGANPKGPLGMPFHGPFAGPVGP